MTRIGLSLIALLLLTLPATAAETVKLGLLKFATNAPVFIALDKGYFTAHGLDVQLVYFDAAQPIAVAAVSGAIDVGMTGIAGGFYNLAGKGALEIIAAQSREEPGYPNNAFLVSDKAWDAGLQSYKDLPGHTLAVTTIGSPTIITRWRCSRTRRGSRSTACACCRCRPIRTRSRRSRATRSMPR